MEKGLPETILEDNQVSEDIVAQTLCGVVILGAPGTGKTTFCKALSEFLTQLERKHAIVNLDPANDNMDYKVRLKALFTVR
jgi:predicted PilT family ATPase